MSTFKLFNKVVLLFILISNFGIAQNYIKINRLKSKFAIKENKEKYYSALKENIKKTFSGEIRNNLAGWNQAFKEAESILMKDSLIKLAVKHSFSLPIDEHKKLQRTTLEIAYSLYQKSFSKEVNKIFLKTADKISYAIGVNYLIDAKFENRLNKFYIENLKERFKNYKKSSILKELLYQLSKEGNSSFQNPPDLDEILHTPFQLGKTVVFSIQRKNRKFPGVVIIRKPNGEFLRNQDGSIFNIPQLALSFSNLPGYIPNGNTPEGIYSIIGWYISPTETIGPTPNLLLRSPFEVSPEIFFHGKNKFDNWNIKDYSSLLPNSWKEYFPIYQSFYAGKSGRKLIIAHGSTDELSFFKGQIYYPLTPTRGCLSAKEIWSDVDGKCIESDQVKLINAFKSTRQKEGFLIVFEIDSKEKPVSINEIEQYLKK